MLSNELVKTTLGQNGGNISATARQLKVHRSTIHRQIQEFLQHKVQNALDQTNGNVTKAAEVLGMTFRQLRYYLSKFKVQRRKPIKGVYFLQFPLDPKLIKIGYSTDIHKRLISIQGHAPVKLELLGVAQGDLVLEDQLKCQFKHLQDHGEWFRPEQMLLDYIKTSTVVPDLKVQIMPAIIREP